jgi:hypothetical protein
MRHYIHYIPSPVTEALVAVYLNGDVRDFIDSPVFLKDSLYN